MKRSGFKVQRPPGSRPPRAAKQIGDGYTIQPRAIAVAVAGPARATVQVPKAAYVRDVRLRTMCQAMPCQNAMQWPMHSGGVTWAHSNQAQHGKGRSIKASDIYIAALCAGCHAWLDQGKADQADKVAMWTAAHTATVRLGQKSGTWPADIPLPPALADDEVTA